MRSASHRFQSGLLPRILFQAVDQVFHHHHLAIDNHAEINGSQTHQVGADAEQPHAEKADHHRKGNDGGSYNRSADIAEK